MSVLAVLLIFGSGLLLGAALATAIVVAVRTPDHGTALPPPPPVPYKPIDLSDRAVARREKLRRQEEIPGHRTTFDMQAGPQ